MTDEQHRGLGVYEAVVFSLININIIIIMYNLEILKKEFKEYQQNMRSSQKQHHLIQKKYQKYVSQNKNPDTLLDILNKCLSRKILNITDVIHSILIINYYNYHPKKKIKFYPTNLIFKK